MMTVVDFSMLQASVLDCQYIDVKLMYLLPGSFTPSSIVTFHFHLMIRLSGEARDKAPRSWDERIAHNSKLTSTWAEFNGVQTSTA